jgi:hypothetical protein
MATLTPWHPRPAIRFFISLSGLLMISGCTQLKNLEYGPFIRDLDGRSELAISTYPADFAQRLSDKGAIFEQYESDRKLYFQVHIRDKETKFGPNPHVRSITIHTFSYQIAGAPPVVLLSEYQDNFWMQNNPRYEDAQPAVDYLPGGNISIEISLTLNGEKFVFEGDMPANESHQYLPTFVVNQSI